MEPDYRELLIMHAYYPRKVPFFNQTGMRTVMFYACLFELSATGHIHVADDRLMVNGRETGDHVLDRVLELVTPLSGAKLSRLQLLVPNKSAAVYRKQMETMTERNYITYDEVSFLFWPLYRKYRVVKQDLLKPSLRELERMLVYGRKPVREKWNFALLALEAGLFRNIFTSAESRKSARKRGREMLKSDFHNENPTIALLHKSMRRTLTAQKASSS
ncbi:MAG: GPP34 family phosphoprotein [Bacteroidales bacterium]|jgi:hypothetical protein|nr:GPP34 family phosphoprotein [Bacteroidales bacterium]